MCFELKSALYFNNFHSLYHLAIVRRSFKSYQTILTRLEASSRRLVGRRDVVLEIAEHIARFFEVANNVPVSSLRRLRRSTSQLAAALPDQLGEVAGVAREALVVEIVHLDLVIPAVHGLLAKIARIFVGGPHLVQILTVRVLSLRKVGHLVFVTQGARTSDGVLLHILVELQRLSLVLGSVRVDQVQTIVRLAFNFFGRSLVYNFACLWGEEATKLGNVVSSQHN